MRAKDSMDIAKKFSELMFRTYYTYRDETRESGDFSISSHAFSLLAKIYFSEKIHTVSELAQMMHMHNPQLSKLLTLIEKNGLVSRNRPDGNRRHVEICITDAGTAYVEKMFGVIEGKIAENLADTELGDPDSVKRSIDQLYTALHID